MKFLIVLALALAAVALAVQGEKITIRGRMDDDPRYTYKYVKVEADTEEKVNDVVIRVCKELTGRTPLMVEARDAGMLWPHLALEDTVGIVDTGDELGLRDGARIAVWCYDESSD